MALSAVTFCISAGTHETHVQRSRVGTAGWESAHILHAQHNNAPCTIKAAIYFDDSIGMELYVFTFHVTLYRPITIGTTTAERR